MNSYLIANALRTISHLSIIYQNYDVAIKLIKEAYLHVNF